MASFCRIQRGHVCPESCAFTWSPCCSVFCRVCLPISGGLLGSSLLAVSCETGSDGCQLILRSAWRVLLCRPKRLGCLWPCAARQRLFSTSMHCLVRYCQGDPGGPGECQQPGRRLTAHTCQNARTRSLEVSAPSLKLQSCTKTARQSKERDEILRHSALHRSWLRDVLSFWQHLDRQSAESLQGGSSPQSTLSKMCTCTWWRDILCEFSSK